MVKLFKNFKTKRQLREEIAFLKDCQNQSKLLFQIGRDVIRIGAQMTIADEVPADIVKRELLHKISDKISPFVSWDIVDSEKGRQLKAFVDVIWKG